MKQGRRIKEGRHTRSSLLYSNEEEIIIIFFFFNNMLSLKFRKNVEMWIN